MNELNTLLLTIVPLLFAVTIHEASHGLAAYLMGDDTAKIYGRLSLNPLKHLDFFGSFVLPIILKLTGAPAFGYAKPVPINPFNFRHFRIGTIVVSAAGVLANLICAVISGALFQYLHTHQAWLGSSVSFIIKPFYHMLGYSVIVNVVLFVFNLIPVPPLDGSKILAMFLPERLRVQFERIERYGMLILMVLIFTNSLNKLMSFFVNPLMNLLLGR